MSYTFQNMSEVPTLEKPTVTTTVMGFDNGAACQIPAGQFGGSGGGGLLFELGEGDLTLDEESGAMMVSKNYDSIYETIVSGGHVTIAFPSGDGPIYINPLYTGLVFGMGLGMYVIVMGEVQIIEFTNGSYHSV